MMVFLACTLLAAVQDNPESSFCSHHKMPVHGTVWKNSLFFFFGDVSRLSATPIDEPKARSELTLTPSNECKAHCRHHLSGEMIWFIHGPERVAWARLTGTGPTTRPVPALLKKYEDERGKKFVLNPGFDPAPGVAIDFVLVSDKTLRLFFFVMKTKKIESWETEWVFERSKNKKGRDVWDWKVVADERNPETIDAAFVEDFHVFKQQADYYFVTQSGKLYVAAPPKKGEKSRTMKSLWQGEKFPIAAVIEDADNDKVWLFTKAKNKLETQAVFFEMAAKIEPQKFDHAKLAPVNIESRARPLLEYLPLIRDKGPQKGRKGEGEKGRRGEGSRHSPCLPFSPSPLLHPFPTQNLAEATPAQAPARLASSSSQRA